MPTAQEWIEQISEQMTHLRGALDAGESKAFEARFHDLTDALASGEDPRQVAADLEALVLATPAAASLLGVQAGNPPGPPKPGTPEGIPPGPPLTPAAPVTPPVPQGEAPMNDEPKTTPAKKAPARRALKVEDYILILKEAVTALIAILLVWTTIRVVTSLLGFVGDETRMTQAKDLLTAMTGMLGVVLGYYFGRIPADARAAQAQEQAAQAVEKSEQAAAQSEMVSARAEELADQASKLAAQMQAAPAVRGVPNAGEELARWAAEVEALRRMARNR